MPQGVESLAARFEEMAAPLERQVYFTCLHMMGKREDAEDAAQETMLRAFRKFDSFKGESLFSTWIYAVAVRVCLDAIKKRRETVSLDLLREEGWDPAGSEPTPSSSLRKRNANARCTTPSPAFRRSSGRPWFWWTCSSCPIRKPRR